MSADPARLILAHAQGAVQDAGRLLKRVPDAAGWVETLRQLDKEIRARLEGMPLQPALELQAETPPPSPKARTEKLELDWRVEDVVKVHLLAYRQHKERAGIRVQNGHSLPDPIRKLIRDALPVYDGDLLRADQREDWRKHSLVRAAGIGIFYDPFMTGDFEPGCKPLDWHGPYLDHDRPFRQRAGKRDPIMHFSSLYFEQRDLAEGT